jgi:hypothetical protein
VLFEAYSKDSVHQLSVSIEIIKTFQTMEEVEKKNPAQNLQICRAQTKHFLALLYVGLQLDHFFFPNAF